jgi:beta-glucosidase
MSSAVNDVDFSKLRSCFNDNFLWGASIAMYQTDGGDASQWAKWEHENAEQLAANYEKNFQHFPGFERFLDEAKDPANYIAADGIRHREHFHDDFDILKSLGFSAFRFSIEWCRVEPKPGEFNTEEIEFIREYIRELKARGILPTMTLWHFTFPQWFADLGGFENAKNIKYFERYCKYVLEELKDDIEWIYTINEPMVYTFCSFGSGEWPPAKKSPFIHLIKIVTNLAKAHNVIYKTAKKINPNFKISVAQNTASTVVGEKGIKAKFNKWFGDFNRDNYFLNRTYKNMDFLGINWYNSDTYYANGVKNPNEKLNDLGWDMRPFDFHIALERLWNKYHLPILVTENGLANGDDSDRLWWIQETIKALVTAQNNGVKLLGYQHWSAFDNFEWDKGYWPRFGLIEVHRSNMVRKVRESAKWYSKFIKKEI